MEKVKVTREVAEAIEWLKERKFTAEDVIVTHATRPNNWILEQNKALNGMLLLNLIDAYRFGYEVVETLKVGDWAKFKDYQNNNPHCGKIEEIIGEKAYAHWNGKKKKGFIHLKDLELMTLEEIKAEQERRAWARIGREVGEFKVGDAYINKSGIVHEFDVLERLPVIEKMYEYGKLRGFYPAESFIEFGGGE